MAVRAMDFLFMGVYSFDLLVQYFYHGRAEWLARGWLRLKMGCLLAMLANLIVHMAVPSFPYFMRIVRPVFLLERMRNVRRVAGNIGATLPRIVNVLILLILHVLIFAVLGMCRACLSVCVRTCVGVRDAAHALLLLGTIVCCRLHAVCWYRRHELHRAQTEQRAGLQRIHK